MIFGMNASAGAIRLSSQLAMVVSSTFSCSATSVCRNPKSSRRLRRWSPNVSRVCGYVAGSGLRAFRRAPQNGNATVLIHRGF